MRLRSRLGLIFLITYLAIFLFAEILAFRSLIFDTANSELSGVPAIFITLPWSIIFGRFWDSVGFVNWYNRFAGSPALYGFFASLTVLPGLIINAAILYYLGSIIDHLAAKSRPPAA
ncbi:MAG TPA: hypothetical protein VFQ24_01735 [Terriglobia bacterium]|nr:hypothetical protein [Terriglobia bacterium]